ncbi:Glucose-1-phosphate thymidylyltransferase [Cyclobacterium qasimii M12-11B]|uniref:Glucose-1-phosphate thymidylyltransferase n=1 Tax=Cyclobacterium qasimii M12-11B TaxID=641524 RepID=S7V784_9BACT|nr:Glucose-1-phosphate thymidylyltransferase [Cyclobacterium qasimii M12-11B]
MKKWQSLLHAKDLGFLTQNYLQSKFPPLAVKALYINGALCPDEDLVNAINELKETRPFGIKTPYWPHFLISQSSSTVIICLIKNGLIMIRK